MLMARIDGATRELGKPKDWDDKVKCNTLAIRDVMVEGSPAMVSAWQPEPAELAMLNNGANVQLWIFGAGHLLCS